MKTDLPLYFEDIPIGYKAASGSYGVSEDEIIEFGRRYDPRPFHTDPELAKDSIFGGLVAPGALVFAIRSALVNSLNPSIAYVAGLGLEHMDLPSPVRPGDQLRLELECTHRRESKSRPDVGIVHLANRICNQNQEVVLTMLAKVMVERKP